MSRPVAVVLAAVVVAVIGWRIAEMFRAGDTAYATAMILILAGAAVCLAVILWRWL